jgi:hypothetical protein
MKTKIYSNLIFTLVIILFASCNDESLIFNENEPLIFSVQYLGGWGMVDENLKINASTIHFSSSYYDRIAMKCKSYQTTIKTSSGLWDNLTRTFNLETFEKIGNGSCRACVDGVDETFSVTKDGEIYSFYNGVIDEHYQQMQDFFDLIFEQIETFRANARYQVVSCN